MLTGMILDAGQEEGLKVDVPAPNMLTGMILDAGQEEG